jgi:hypothetical protein
MIKFKQYCTLVESNNDTALKAHLTHLEDLAIEEGRAGFTKFVEQVENFINYLEGIRSKTSVNLKIDGAPALFFGIDPRPEHSGKFFIGTKTVFTNFPNLIHSVEEVDELYKDAAPGLRDLLKTIFPYFQQGYDGSGKMYQGDLLFSPTRPPVVREIENKNYITFQPNLITYAVPIDTESKLYNEISNAKVGIVVHAGFEIQAEGNRIVSTPAGRDVTSVVLSLKKAGVFAEGSNYSTLNLTIDESARRSINALLTTATSKINNITPEFNEEYLSNTTLTAYLKQYLNYMVREGGGMFKAAREGRPFDRVKFFNGFLKFVYSKIDKASEKLGAKGKANAQKKKESVKNFIYENIDSLYSLLEATYNMAQIKEYFLKLLSNVKGKLDSMKSFIPVGDEYITVPGEGHVLYIGDTPNQVKIVDRLNFSANNFLYSGERGRSASQPKKQIDEEDEPVLNGPAEEDSKQYSIGLFGGGFNPPHIGHFEAALIAAKENNDVYIVISPQERGGTNINVTKKVNIWNQYLPLLEQYKAKVHIVVAEVSPISTIYEYIATLNESPEASNITVKLYTDVDEAGRYNNIEKYSGNLKKIEIKPTPRLASGTEFRAYLDAGDKYSAFKLLPTGVDKEAVWRVLKSL